VNRSLQAAIDAIPENLGLDVSVIELLLDIEELDERRPFIQVSWNTNEHLARMRASSDPCSAGRLEWDSQDFFADLHSSGLIKRAFGQPVPVLIDSFEPHDPITELSHKANPPELHAVLDRLTRKE
jgi:hypothetical protein